MKIVSIDTKEEVKCGEVGEICIAGPVVMPGYLDNEKETNDMLEKDEKGVVWVHTGDLGFVDEEGLLHYVQRLKRMLIVSGYNVYPSHIENVLLEHPAILNCGVVGIPHPYKVQVPKAYIVLENGYKVNSKIKQEIKEYCEKKLAHYMIPKEFEFRESLPKTMIGKVNYRELEKENKK
jgi:long-chain acyl-CoA synthetase